MSLTGIERELAKVKRELPLAKMARDILKKAAANFAKESLQGTRFDIRLEDMVWYKD